MMSILFLFIMQLSWIILFGISNMIGGRWKAVAGEQSNFPGRLVFRCLLPGLMAGSFTIGATESWIFGTGVGILVLIGCFAWSRNGWSFDEITGVFTPGKYFKWVEKLGLKLYPDTSDSKKNKKRGRFMKGIRGLLDITPLLLAVINPWTILLYPLGFAQGWIFWLVGKAMGDQETTVLTAELVHGMFRGLVTLIGMFLAIMAFEDGSLFTRYN